MTYPALSRTLWHANTDGRTNISQLELTQRTEPLVILGEAGMGKTCLLEWLASLPGYSRCTANQLINRVNPKKLLGDANVLVIDALDEVRARMEGDAVSLVLRKLGELDYPRFVLSCRVADWRSATGLEAIHEQYDIKPLELHLEPFDKQKIFDFLSIRLGGEVAGTVIEHFRARRLSGMLGNPQTLELIAEVARVGELPETQGELFERAIEILRVEHRDTKAHAQLDREASLDAAGAAFAALILTGSEVIVRKSPINASDGELVLADLACLPGGGAVELMLGARLFQAQGSDRFSYCHRRVGEFLGARWLAKHASTKRKRERLFGLFNSGGLVPANLRGIHAWLARNPGFAMDVISADPMGIIEYGDAENLTVKEARAILRALEGVAASNPGFRDSKTYSMGGLVQPSLLEDARRLITNSGVPVGLRLLVLEALNGAGITSHLAADLKALVLDRDAVYACRSEAGVVISNILSKTEWEAVIQTLQQYSDAMSIRLALDLIDRVGHDAFGDDLIVDLAIAFAQAETRMVGVLTYLAKRVPQSKIEGMLDYFAHVTKGSGTLLKQTGDHSLNDFACHLISRRIAAGNLRAEKIWSWLEAVDASAEHRRDIRRTIEEYMRSDIRMRRAIQHFVLFEQTGELGIRSRAWLLEERSHGLVLTEEDVVALLQTLDPTNRGDERWRDIVELAYHHGERGAAVRRAAQPFIAGDRTLHEWLEGLAVPRIPEWELRKTEREHKEAERLELQWNKDINYFMARIDQLCAGDGDALIRPSLAYLNLSFDVPENKYAHECIAEWLGARVCDAVLLGLEVFLVANPPKITAKEVSERLTRGAHCNLALVLVAAVCERIRKGLGLERIPDEHLMASYFEVRHSPVDDQVGVEGIREALETEIQVRGIWKGAMRLYHEPQFEARRESIDGLSDLMRDTTHTATAVELAVEWLERFPAQPSQAELEMTRCLLRSGKVEELRRVIAGRFSISGERRHNWDALNLIINFEHAVAHFEAAGLNHGLIWSLRSFFKTLSREDAPVIFTPDLLGWSIQKFRSLWPLVNRPTGITVGNTNAWDASEFICQLVQRLGNDTGDLAVQILKRLRDTPQDGYTNLIQVVAAEQARMRVEANYTPPTIGVLNAIVQDQPPVTVADLQTLMLEELQIVQAKIKSDDAESWRGFYDDHGIPYGEERCRDHLLGLLRQGSEGITLEPETHVASDKEVDITCSVSMLRMPIEIKGQWHRELWQALDTQLDALYTQDWRAESRGIYLVLWFGEQQGSKQLSSPGRGIDRPDTPEKLREMLMGSSAATREGRVRVFVLDLARPSLAGSR